MKSTIRLGLQINSTDSDYAKGLIFGVQAWCQEQNVPLIVFSGRSFGWPYGYEYQNSAIYSHLHTGNLDALIIISGTQCNFISRDDFTRFIENLAPLPLVSVTIPVEGIPSVLVDNKSGLRNLLNHLVDEHDCSRIAVMKGPDDNDEACQRFSVYQEVLEARGLPVDPDLVFYGDFSAEYSLVSLRQHVDARGVDFDALVCLNDTMAIGCLHYLREKGFRVPEDVIVTGFDDILRARYDVPTLTTVSQDLIEQGKIAAEYAWRRAKGEDDIPPVTVHRTRAIFRQSCGCVPREPASFIAISEEGAKIPANPSASFETGMEWFRIQDDIVRLRHYLSHLISLLSLQDLMEDLRTSLESFMIRSCVIVLYRQEIRTRRSDVFVLPTEAEVLLCYDEETPRTGRKKPVLFNPREHLYPLELFSGRTRNLVACALYHREEQLGYILYEPGNCDPSIYETLCVQLSTTIRSALAFAEKQAAEERLNDALYNLEKSNRKLSTISRTDELTGLYNRRGFVTLGQQTIDLALRMGKRGLVVFGDMDGLKLINDSLGHEAGDRAIIAMGQALKKVFRNLDIVSRLGGDEFAVVAVDIDTSFVNTLRNRLERVLTLYNETSGEEYILSLSLGAVEFSGDKNNNLETLLSLADSLLYEEKREKRKRRQDQEK
ncbi:MAG: GGDEF domain-containing protein [Spirochaetales bacterium]|nr:GGDEF domain-containing protein [Spirochaetales bacterium]